VIKRISRVTLARGSEHKKNWIQLGSKEAYVQSNCVIKPKLDPKLTAGTSGVSDENGEFTLMAQLPEGDIQLLFLLDGDKPSSHLFTFEVSSSQVKSPTQFIANPQPKARSEPVATAPHPPASAWTFISLFGIGFNYHSLDQGINE